MKLNRHRVNGIPLSIYEHDKSWAADNIVAEMEHDVYGIRGLDLKPGDVVIDIGGHVGIVSILLAKMYPGIKVFTYEAYTPNYDLLVLNLELNEVDNVFARNVAVTGHWGMVHITGNEENSGGTSIHTEKTNLTLAIPCITLGGVFRANKIEHCAFLKIDCEGSEYDVLGNFTHWSQVGQLSGEFHVGSGLSGKDPQALLNYCASKTKIRRVHFCNRG